MAMRRKGWYLLLAWILYSFAGGHGQEFNSAPGGYATLVGTANQLTPSATSWVSDFDSNEAVQSTVDIILDNDIQTTFHPSASDMPVETTRSRLLSEKFTAFSHLTSDTVVLIADFSFSTEFITHALSLSEMAEAIGEETPLLQPVSDNIDLRTTTMPIPTPVDVSVESFISAEFALTQPITEVVSSVRPRPQTEVTRRFSRSTSAETILELSSLSTAEIIDSLPSRLTANTVSESASIDKPTPTRSSALPATSTPMPEGTDLIGSSTSARTTSIYAVEDTALEVDLTVSISDDDFSAETGMSPFLTDGTIELPLPATTVSVDLDSEAASASAQPPRMSSVELSPSISSTSTSSLASSGLSIEDGLQTMLSDEDEMTFVDDSSIFTPEHVESVTSSLEQEHTADLTTVFPTATTPVTDRQTLLITGSSLSVMESSQTTAFSASVPPVEGSTNLLDLSTSIGSTLSEMPITSPATEAILRTTFSAEEESDFLDESANYISETAVSTKGLEQVGSIYLTAEFPAASVIPLTDSVAPVISEHSKPFGERTTLSAILSSTSSSSSHSSISTDVSIHTSLPVEAETIFTPEPTESLLEDTLEVSFFTPGSIVTFPPASTAQITSSSKDELVNETTLLSTIFTAANEIPSPLSSERISDSSTSTISDADLVDISPTRSLPFEEKETLSLELPSHVSSRSTDLLVTQLETEAAFMSSAASFSLVSPSEVLSGIATSSTYAITISTEDIKEVLSSVSLADEPADFDGETTSFGDDLISGDLTPYEPSLFSSAQLETLAIHVSDSSILASESVSSFSEDIKEVSPTTALSDGPSIFDSQTAASVDRFSTLSASGDISVAVTETTFVAAISSATKSYTMDVVSSRLSIASSVATPADVSETDFAGDFSTSIIEEDGSGQSSTQASSTTDTALTSSRSVLLVTPVKSELLEDDQTTIDLSPTFFLGDHSSFSKDITTVSLSLSQPAEVATHMLSPSLPTLLRTSITSLTSTTSDSTTIEAEPEFSSLADSFSDVFSADFPVTTDRLLDITEEITAIETITSTFSHSQQPSSFTFLETFSPVAIDLSVSMTLQSSLRESQLDQVTEITILPSAEGLTSSFTAGSISAILSQVELPAKTSTEEQYQSASTTLLIPSGSETTSVPLPTSILTSDSAVTSFSAESATVDFSEITVEPGSGETIGLLSPATFSPSTLLVFTQPSSAPGVLLESTSITSSPFSFFLPASQGSELPSEFTSSDFFPVKSSLQTLSFDEGKFTSTQPGSNIAETPSSSILVVPFTTELDFRTLEVMLPISTASLFSPFSEEPPTSILLADTSSAVLDIESTVILQPPSPESSTGRTTESHSLILSTSLQSTAASLLSSAKAVSPAESTVHFSSLAGEEFTSIPFDEAITETPSSSLPVTALSSESGLSTLIDMLIPSRTLSLSSVSEEQVTSIILVEGSSPVLGIKSTVSLQTPIPEISTEVHTLSLSTSLQSLTSQQLLTSFPTTSTRDILDVLSTPGEPSPFIQTATSQVPTSSLHTEIVLSSALSLTSLPTLFKPFSTSAQQPTSFLDQTSTGQTALLTSSAALSLHATSMPVIMFSPLPTSTFVSQSLTTVYLSSDVAITSFTAASSIIPLPVTSETVTSSSTTPTQPFTEITTEPRTINVTSPTEAGTTIGTRETENATMPTITMVTNVTAVPTTTATATNDTTPASTNETFTATIATNISTITSVAPTGRTFTATATSTSTLAENITTAVANTTQILATSSSLVNVTSATPATTGNVTATFATTPNPFTTNNVTTATPPYPTTTDNETTATPAYPATTYNVTTAIVATTPFFATTENVTTVTTPAPANATTATIATTPSLATSSPLSDNATSANITIPISSAAPTSVATSPAISSPSDNVTSSVATTNRSLVETVTRTNVTEPVTTLITASEQPRHTSSLVTTPVETAPSETPVTTTVSPNDWVVIRVQLSIENPFLLFGKVSFNRDLEERLVLAFEAALNLEEETSTTSPAEIQTTIRPAEESQTTHSPEEGRRKRALRKDFSSSLFPAINADRIWRRPRQKRQAVRQIRSNVTATRQSNDGSQGDIIFYIHVNQVLQQGDTVIRLLRDVLPREQLGQQIGFPVVDVLAFSEETAFSGTQGSSDDTLAVWAIILIVIGGFSILIFILMMFYRHRSHQRTIDLLHRSRTQSTNVHGRYGRKPSSRTWREERAEESMARPLSRRKSPVTHVDRLKRFLGQNDDDLFASPTPTESMVGLSEHQAIASSDKHLADLHLPALPATVLIDQTGLQQGKVAEPSPQLSRSEDDEKKVEAEEEQQTLERTALSTQLQMTETLPNALDFGPAALLMEIKPPPTAADSSVVLEFVDPTEMEVKGSMPTETPPPSLPVILSPRQKKALPAMTPPAGTEEVDSGGGREHSQAIPPLPLRLHQQAQKDHWRNKQRLGERRRQAEREAEMRQQQKEMLQRQKKEAQEEQHRLWEEEKKAREQEAKEMRQAQREVAIGLGDLPSNTTSSAVQTTIPVPSVKRAEQKRRRDRWRRVEPMLGTADIVYTTVTPENVPAKSGARSGEKEEKKKKKPSVDAAKVARSMRASIDPRRRDVLRTKDDAQHEVEWLMKGSDDEPQLTAFNRTSHKQREGKHGKESVDLASRHRLLDVGRGTMQEVGPSDVSDHDNSVTLQSMKAKIHNLMDIAFGLIMPGGSSVSPMPDQLQSGDETTDVEKNEARQLANALRPVVDQHIRRKPPAALLKRPSQAWSESESDAAPTRKPKRPSPRAVSVTPVPADNEMSTSDEGDSTALSTQQPRRHPLAAGLSLSSTLNVTGFARKQVSMPLSSSALQLPVHSSAAANDTLVSRTLQAMQPPPLVRRPESTAWTISTPKSSRAAMFQAGPAQDRPPSMPAEIKTAPSQMPRNWLPVESLRGPVQLTPCRLVRDEQGHEIWAPDYSAAQPSVLSSEMPTPSPFAPSPTRSPENQQPLVVQIGHPSRQSVFHRPPEHMLAAAAPKPSENQQLVDAIRKELLRLTSTSSSKQATRTPSQKSKGNPITKL